jgi:hypothetical protein
LLSPADESRGNVRSASVEATAALSVGISDQMLPAVRRLFLVSGLTLIVL